MSAPFSTQTTAMLWASDVKSRELQDVVRLCGNEIGHLPRNKTGDIASLVNGHADLQIVIECKFDKTIRLGDINSKDIFIRKTDTALGQLIESKVNRSAQSSIIVFDISLTDSSILKMYDNVGFIPNIGFIAIIDSQKGDYSNLAIAYMLARDIILNLKNMNFDQQVLCMIVARIIRSLDEALAIKSLVQSNIENSKAILKQLEKSFLMMDMNRKYLMKFLTEGTLSSGDLLTFYQGEEAKDKFKMTEKEIDDKF